MRARSSGWMTAQQAAVMLKTTSAEVCRLVSVGRLSGKKRKQPGRPGIAQWTISPASVAREVRRVARLAGESRRRKAGNVSKQFAR